MNRIVNDGADYKTYRGLPAIAGICGMREAIDPGLSVDECVRRLKRHHYALRRLHEIFTAHITAEPVYELKMAFSLHAHLCAEHVAALRKRVGEMREPPLGLEAVPHDDLEIFFDEILTAPTTEERIVGIYEKAVPAVIESMQRHIADTNPLADHPSIRVCRFALLELDDMLAFGKKAVACLVDENRRASMQAWLGVLDCCLARAGALDGTREFSTEPAQRKYSVNEYVYDREPKRDERFQDPFNMGVNAEAFLYDPKFPAPPKVLMMFFKRIREIDVPEMMASIITETKNKPWDYYREMTRQLWDEARHAMMGEVGFVSAGVDWTKIPINFTWSRGLNTQLTPIERHAVLYFIEQGLMPKTGKRFEWETGIASQHPLSALFQDFDWADEVLHAAVGRNWYIKEIGDAKKAIDYGDTCWSKVVSDWKAWRDAGLTQHRNWWPEIYGDACRAAGIEPDAAILAYATTYENTRADLKTVSG
jgi:hypothetical protein